MHNEVRETIYIGIQVVLAALVLGFIILAMNLRDNMATAYNTGAEANMLVRQYREFNKFDSKVLNGNNMISGILQYYDQGIEVFVHYRKNIATGEVVNNVCPMHNDCDRRKFNRDQYERHPADFYIDVISEIPTNDSITKWFQYSDTYYTMLVYNGLDVVTAYEQARDRYTAIRLGEYGHLVGPALTDAVKQTILGRVADEMRRSPSEVTGVICLRLSEI